MYMVKREFNKMLKVVVVLVEVLIIRTLNKCGVNSLADKQVETEKEKESHQDFLMIHFQEVDLVEEDLVEVLLEDLVILVALEILLEEVVLGLVVVAKEETKEKIGELKLIREGNNINKNNNKKKKEKKRRKKKIFLKIQMLKI